VKTHLAVRRLALPALAALLVSTLVSWPGARTDTQALACPPGYHLEGEEEARLSLYGDVLDVRTGTELCIHDKHPETERELRYRDSQRMAIASAPDGIIPAGAYETAFRQRTAMARAGQSAANDNRWQPVGNGPLHTMDDGYGEGATGRGDVNGRVNDFFYVPRDDAHLPDTLLATASYGGVWVSDSNASKWTSIGDNLPTQVVSSVAYTPEGGGTIMVLTGDDSFGADSRQGVGLFYTTNLGKTWLAAKGMPRDVWGFKLAVDQARKSIVYAATGSGLYRSTDAGRSFVNVKLPTGECAGQSNRTATCAFANVVTDVIVQMPGGTTDEAGGKVMAAVGWRAGQLKYPGTDIVQSPNNGIYVSDTGAPGTFEKSAATGFAPQDRIGRTELGPAEGPAQNHNYVYAMVQDAVLLRNGPPGIDVPEAYGVVPRVSVFHGLYVSSDFGRTWRIMVSQPELLSPATGSALTAYSVLARYGPGIQAWFNAFVRPDPTKAINGIPTRVVFGLEEVFQNENTNVPQDGHSAFKVIGRYWSGDSCMGLMLPPATTYCATQREGIARTTTTHSDQHDVIFIPFEDGSVRMVVGNDGGVYSQRIAADVSDFSNANWGYGNNEGFNTLLPYDAVRSRDGTFWMGLQDNGTAKITDIVRNGRVIERQRQIQTKGGDGFFVAVHPDNGNIAYGEYTGGTIASTVNGGKTWSEMSPPITSALFSTPFTMDPADPNHLMIGGNEIVSTLAGPGTSRSSWVKLIDLGTHSKPGDEKATPNAQDPVNQQTAVALHGAAGYAGFCGPCDVLNTAVPFKNGIATNVGGSQPPKKGASQGWHIAKAAGLPNRYITGIAIHPSNPEIVFVSLGGYFRPWTKPNVIGAKNSRVGEGHLYVSTDGAKTFRNISANLPNTPISFLTLRPGTNQVVAATDVGVFISVPGGRFEVLGQGLPMVPVHTVRFTNGDPNTLVAAAYGRGVYMYSFGPARAAAAKRVAPAPRFLNKVVAGPWGFETGEDGFTQSSTGAAIEWRRASPGNDSGFSWVLSGYEDSASAILQSPAMNVPARSTIQASWYERHDTEACCDYFSFEWSSDNKNWHQARSIAGQNPTFPGFSKMSARFVVPQGRLWIRWRMTSDSGLSTPPYTGIAIDDVEVRR